MRNDKEKLSLLKRRKIQRNKLFAINKFDHYIHRDEKTTQKSKQSKNKRMLSSCYMMLIDWMWNCRLSLCDMMFSIRSDYLKIRNDVCLMWSVDLCPKYCNCVSMSHQVKPHIWMWLSGRNQKPKNNEIFSMLRDWFCFIFNSKAVISPLTWLNCFDCILPSRDRHLNHLIPYLCCAILIEPFACGHGTIAKSIAWIIWSDIFLQNHVLNNLSEDLLSLNKKKTQLNDFTNLKKKYTNFFSIYFLFSLSRYFMYIFCCKSLINCAYMSLHYESEK